MGRPPFWNSDLVYLVKTGCELSWHFIFQTNIRYKPEGSPIKKIEFYLDSIWAVVMHTYRISATWEV
jgi:hypothetical protein